MTLRSERRGVISGRAGLSSVDVWQYTLSCVAAKKTCVRACVFVCVAHVRECIKG